jgi:hypothetical protein
VLLSFLPVTHVAIDRGELCRLPERPIVSQVASAKRCRSAAHLRSSLLIRTGRTVTRACSRYGRLHGNPRCVLAWSIAVQPFLPCPVSPLVVEIHEYGQATCKGTPLQDNRSRNQVRRQSEGADSCGTPTCAHASLHYCCHQTTTTTTAVEACSRAALERCTDTTGPTTHVDKLSSGK